MAATQQQINSLKVQEKDQASYLAEAQQIYVDDLAALTARQAVQAREEAKLAELAPGTPAYTAQQSTVLDATRSTNRAASRLENTTAPLVQRAQAELNTTQSQLNALQAAPDGTQPIPPAVSATETNPTNAPTNPIENVVDTIPQDAVTVPYENPIVESITEIESVPTTTESYVIPGLQGGVDPAFTGAESPETTEPYVSGQTGFPVDETLASTPAPADAYVAGQTGIPIDDKYTNADGETITDQNMGGPSTGAEAYTQGQGENRNQVVFPAQKDWRFRISLAPSAKYLYNDPTIDKDTDILGPLTYTQGVVFPYLPTISMSHAANYDATDLAHTNYKIYQYKNSNVGDISIQAEFTAQDTNEANYLLATMHFFKCVTKMFYGRDEDPRAGTPPPLVYLSGYGAFQFDYHPVAITSFTYTLPNDVDYIRAGVVGQMGGQNLAPYRKEKQLPTTNVASLFSSFFRLSGSGLRPGASYPRPNFTQTLVNDPTYVPTKISLQLNCIPMISRYNMANKFSLRDYATGSLLRGSKTQTGGMW